MAEGVQAFGEIWLGGRGGVVSSAQTGALSSAHLSEHWRANAKSQSGLLLAGFGSPEACSYRADMASEAGQQAG